MEIPSEIKEIVQFITEAGGIMGVIAGALASVYAFSSKTRIWCKTTWSSYKTNRSAKKNMPSLVAQIHDNVTKMDVRLIKVEKEMSPNGGGSMKDQLKLIKAELDATNWLTPRPTFRTTSSGINLYVNEAYCQLCACSPEELLKLGWKSFVADEDQADEFYDRWILAAKNLSQFASRLKIQSKLGEYRGEWMIRIRPLGPIESTNLVEDYLWNGNLYPSDDIAKTYAKSFGIPTF